MHIQISQSEPDKPVLVAGDPERAHVKKVEKDGGIYYHNNLMNAMVSKPFFSSLVF